jgi:ribulose-phosphate 3-epimerase
MISHPKKFIKDFADAGCDSLIVHIEADSSPAELLRDIRGYGCRACLALNPPTPLEAVEPYLGEVDGVLVMSVSPGFGGQKFDASVLSKVESIRRRHPKLVVGIDGGVNPSTAGAAASAGATHLIAGSAVFKSGDSYASALAELAEAASRGG